MIDRSTILVCDDDESVRTAVQLVLSRAGLLVEAYAAAEELRERLKASNNVALVILDVMLPTMDGVTLSRHLAQDHPHVRVVFLTALVDPLAVPSGYECIVKPFANADLINRVRGILRDHDHARQFTTLGAKVDSLATTVAAHIDSEARTRALLEENVVMATSVASRALATAGSALTTAQSITLPSLSVSWWRNRDPILWGLITLMAGYTWYAYKADAAAFFAASRKVPAIEQQIQRVEGQIGDVRTQQQAMRDDVQVLLRRLPATPERATAPGVRRP